MIRFVFAAAAALFCATLAHAQALALQGLTDDVRATVKKELARQRSASNDAAADDPAPAADRRRKDCTMTIGPSDGSAGRGRRDVTIVATKPIVQMCK